VFAFIALLGIIFEEQTGFNKAKVTLFFGTLSWVLMFIFSGNGAEHLKIIHGLSENISEIATLWIFLLSAMTFVAYLNKKGLIENVIYLVLPTNITEKKLLFLTGIFCFIFSSLADNITATLVSITLVSSLGLSPKKLIRFAVLVVFGVNSGGVSLITGDVTTLMIFLGGKVHILNLLLLAVPAFLTVIVLAFFLSFGLSGEVMIEKKQRDVRRLDVVIGCLFLSTIVLTIAGNFFFQIPPVLTFLTGLSIMFLLAHHYRDDTDEIQVLDYIRYIEFETLLFFLGILLIVGMLKEVGLLSRIPEIYTTLSPLIANYVMGLISATIDNVPLTAALLKAGLPMGLADWMGLTYAVGVGGSLMVIGSAAGVVAMSKVKGLTFGAYLKYSFWLFLAYTLGYIAVYFVGLILQSAH
jgi:Na+/H+ antiporter NhaD/arsenite permease-like protein